MQPIVMHGLGHDRLESLNKYSMSPSMLRKRKFCGEEMWDKLRGHPSQGLTEL